MGIDGMTDLFAEPWDVMLNRARAELGHVTAAHSGLFGLDRADWNIDLTAGSIRFAADGMPEAHATIQVVGTRDPNDGTWLWGWDHPSVPQGLRHAALDCRRYGERHGLTALTTRKIACSAAEAWDFTAVARRLHRAEGAYRADAGAEVFVAYSRLTIASGASGVQHRP
jgi:hypothetical protein